MLSDFYFWRTGTGVYLFSILGLMKKFILKILIYLLTLLVFVLAVNFTLNTYTRSRAQFKLKKQPSSIVVGHSHPECAFNDSLIHGLKNFSSSGESYFYTYPKLKNIVLNNDSIQNIFIEFTNNQIYKDMDDWIFGKKFLHQYYPTFDAFLDKEQQRILFNNSPANFLNALSQSKKKQLFRVFKNDFDLTDEMGGYLYLKRFKTDSLLKHNRGKIHIQENTIDSFPVSKLSLCYLRKMIDFCRKQHKKVYLIRSPQHFRYSAMKNEKVFQHILKKEFSDVEFLDFVNFQLKNSEYGDLGHLNYLGAEKFSVWIDFLLKNGLLDKTDKQSFINSHIK